jgi:hypothetical protein
VFAKLSRVIRRTPKKVQAPEKSGA